MGKLQAHSLKEIDRNSFVKNSEKFSEHNAKKFRLKIIVTEKS